MGLDISTFTNRGQTRIARAWCIGNTDKSSNMRLLTVTEWFPNKSGVGQNAAQQRCRASNAHCSQHRATKRRTSRFLSVEPDVCVKLAYKITSFVTRPSNYSSLADPKRTCKAHVLSCCALYTKPQAQTLPRAQTQEIMDSCMISCTHCALICHSTITFDRHRHVHAHFAILDVMALSHTHKGYSHLCNFFLQ